VLDQLLKKRCSAAALRVRSACLGNKSAQKWGVHMGLALCLLQSLSIELAVCFEVLSEKVHGDLLDHDLVCSFVDSADPSVNQVSGRSCFEAVSA